MLATVTMLGHSHCNHASLWWQSAGHRGVSSKKCTTPGGSSAPPAGAVVSSHAGLVLLAGHAPGQRNRKAGAPVVSAGQLVRCRPITDDVEPDKSSLVLSGGSQVLNSLSAETLVKQGR